ncbi:MAG: class I SAM-dependent methyltransferase [Pseudomonadales bacterium]|nr:class I SAM-dependent methyltransferase [Pseudomonadales bacterium]
MLGRIKLHNSTLKEFSSPTKFDAATAILVSQHLSPVAEAQEFFKQIASFLKPSGLLYSADIHIASGQERDYVMGLWRNNLIVSGLESDMADGMLLKN